MIVQHLISRPEGARPHALGACAIALLSLLWAQAARCQTEPGLVGGSLAATSDYIYRGVSQSDGQGALQADLHLGLASGTFAGVWASTRDRSLQPLTPAELQAYLGQRFALGGGAWSAAVSGRADYFVGGSPIHSYDYQEISAALSWLDRCTLTFTAIPNAVRFSLVHDVLGGQPVTYYRGNRAAAYVADGSSQWLLREGVLGGGLYLTAAIGYYYSTQAEYQPQPALGYLYGNAGVALERRHWRIDIGYFAAQSRAAQLLPYPVARRFAGTVSWQF